MIRAVINTYETSLFEKIKIMQTQPSLDSKTEVFLRKPPIKHLYLIVFSKSLTSGLPSKADYTLQ